MESAVHSVRPVVDYEPPPRDLRQCRPPSATPLRRPNTRPPQGFPGRPQATSVPPQMRQAAIFADAALRRVLEVMDRRRPAAQLQGLLDSGLVDSVLAATRATAGRVASDDGAAAVLRRLRLQAVSPTAAEVFGTYSRGHRVHAVACRVERQADTRWQLVALHIG
ncbi:hypothetical protein CQY23_02055 [Mycobacterium celatum]|uniref:Alanine, arginine and proline rich protein n=1 Tax=Mycobacterium celatum TaxID=28045 RepID=A0A2G5PQR1_MYCCE|nr:hypothetical protein CQY23_02055 [Mycobacterium celatum]